MNKTGQEHRLMNALKRKRVIAFLVILTERLSLHLWRIFFWSLLFCALWMFQIPVLFGTPGSIMALVVFLTGLVWLLHKDALALRLPAKKDIDRKLERSSNLKHRPVTELDDTLANPGKEQTLSLWNESKKRMVKALARLKNPSFISFAAQKDPYALRLAILLFFLIGLAVSGPGWNERIWNGLTPVSFAGDFKKTSGTSLWIIPPEYTGISQILLEGGKEREGTLEVPAGSQIKIRVTGGLGHPQMVIGKTAMPLEYLGDDSYGLEIEAPDTGSLQIKQLHMTRARWNYHLIPDEPPAVKPKGEPEILSNGQIRFPLTVYDDYGVKDISMFMALDNMVEEKPVGEPVEETRSVMSPGKTDFTIQPVYDLTAHPWAGLPVTIRLSVSDHIEQISGIAPVKMILPERNFRHPVARQLVSLRKKLSWEPLKDAADISKDLETLLTHPSAFNHDKIVFLTIRSAASRLYHSKDIRSSKSVIDLLWDTALRVEDGNITLAARNLRDAQMALEGALQNPDTTNAEISRLMNELRSAMAEYLMELQKEIQKRMAENKNMQILPPEMFSSMIDPESLSSFLDQLESEMKSDNKNAAQQMLSQLQRMMDTLAPSMNTPMPPDMQMMVEGINELQELIGRQQALLDQTQGQIEASNIFHLPEEEESKPPAINTQKNKVEQEALRYVLGQLMLEAAEALDKIPENMGLAEQEMRKSARALDDNKPVISIPHQEQAILHLKESMEQLSQQLMARIQQVTGIALSGGMRLDPLGRPSGSDGERPGILPGSRVKIPDAAERKRADEILRLLRRRAGEIERPEYELDYYRRLLRQF